MFFPFNSPQALLLGDALIETLEDNGYDFDQITEMYIDNVVSSATINPNLYKIVHWADHLKYDDEYFTTSSYWTRVGDVADGVCRPSDLRCVCIRRTSLTIESERWSCNHKRLDESPTHCKTCEIWFSRVVNTKKVIHG